MLNTSLKAVIWGFFLLLLVNVQTVFSAPSPDGKNDVVQLTYEMGSQGMTFGSSNMTRQIIERDGKKFLQEKTSSNLMLSVQNTVGSEEVALLTLQGELLEYNARHTQKEEVFRVRARLDGNKLKFWAGEGDGEMYHWKDVKKKDYDFTSVHIPFDRLKLKKGKTVIRHFIMLDDENLKIYKNKMKWKGTEKQKIGDREFECQVIDIDFGVIKATLWVAKDDLGYFLLKEEGEGSFGPFTMKCVDYITNPQNQPKEDFGF